MLGRGRQAAGARNRVHSFDSMKCSGYAIGECEEALREVADLIQERAMADLT